MATMDFSAWLGAADLEGHEEIYGLYSAIKNQDSYGPFTCVATANGKGWIVTSTDSDEPLLLASDDARATFLSTVTTQFCEGMDMEGWYAYRQAMEKDD